jgi:hypothetical protein
VGFGVGGAVVPFDLLAEFLPNKHRGTFLIYIEGFWTIGMSKLKCDGACGYVFLTYMVCVCQAPYLLQGSHGGYYLREDGGY